MASTDLIFVFIWGYYIENYGKQKKISIKFFFGLASEKTDKKRKITKKMAFLQPQISLIS